jgi:hypothetical protein
LAGVIGPALMALGATEAMNMDIYASQTPNVVYLNGTVLFIAGLALVRLHNLWLLGWPLLVTLTGWSALTLGFYRMLFPAAPQATNSTPTYLMLAGLFIVGAVLSFIAYRPHVSKDRSD